MALRNGGPSGAALFAERIEEQLRTVMVLTGSRTLADLARAPRIVRGELASYMDLVATS
jgi:isopentenyl diphosphate isomerase/L-lactate dehydrogenase-like FMN-dependent dehydrogenase